MVVQLQLTFTLITDLHHRTPRHCHCKACCSHCQELDSPCLIRNCRNNCERCQRCSQIAFPSSWLLEIQPCEPRSWYACATSVQLGFTPVMTRRIYCLYPKLITRTLPSRKKTHHSPAYSVRRSQPTCVQNHASWALHLPTPANEYPAPAHAEVHNDTVELLKPPGVAVVTDRVLGLPSVQQP